MIHFSVASKLDLGAFLARARKIEGLTQKELAERFKVSQQTIGKIEKGIISIPQKITLDYLNTINIKKEDYTKKLLELAIKELENF